MALLNSIKKDLENHIQSAYGAHPDQIKEFSKLLREDPNCYGKLSNKHFTSSAVVIDPQAQQMLLVNHKKYHQWLAFGGHWNDNNYMQETIFQGAIREMFEEGFNNQPINFSVLNNTHPIDLDIHQAGDDIHYDLAFLVSVSKDEPFTLSNEAKNIAWLNIDSIIENRNNLFNERITRIAEKVREIYPQPTIKKSLLI